MPEVADAWWEDLKQEAELPPPPPARPLAPIILTTLAAALIIGVAAWWLSTPGRTYFDNPALRAAPAQPVRVASGAADAEQVRRAYEEFGLVYANSGPDGLARFSESCAESLRSDPRILDFCLAFDLFTAAVAEEPAPTDAADARHVALVRAAAPGVDPTRRIAEVRRLMRAATGLQTASAGSENAASQAELRAAVQADARPVRLAKAEPPRKARAADACRGAPTPADRLICATPTLKVQERRMKAAYERALAAGADPLSIDRGQAEWRAERDGVEDRATLAELYARRTRELNEAAESAARTPLS